MYKKYFYNSPAFFALLIIVVVMVIRASWMGKGVYAFSDETRYAASQYLVDQLLQGNVKEGFRALTQTDARPADCLLHVIPALLQYFIVHPQGIHHPDSLKWVQYFHILVFGLLSVVFYWVSTLLFPQKKYYALMALTCFVLVINNHVHARHILPYDAALLLCLMVLGRILYAHQKNGWVSSSVKFSSGILAALAWLTYPGYYWVPVLMIGYLVLASGKRKVMEVWKEIFPFLLGALFLFIPFELLYWCYGKSLFYGLAGLSLGINQGDYHESLQFLITYMQDSNGGVGGVLSYAFLLVGVLMLLKLLVRPMPVFDPLQVFLALAFGAWLFHMLLGEVLEFMVFYGRLVHAFVPFMIWALLALCIRINWLTVPIFLFILLGNVIAFWKFNEIYQTIVYPRDVLYTFSTYQPSGKRFPVLELAKDRKDADRYCNRHAPYAYYNLQDRRIEDTLTFYNTAILYPIEGQEVVRCERQGSQMLLRAPYYLCFSPYGFEGYSPSARKSLQSGLYTTEVKSILH